MPVRTHTPRASDISTDAAARKKTAALEAAFLSAGGLYPPSRFSGALAEQLQRSPDPHMTLTNLLRFVEAVPTPAALFNDLLQYPPLFGLLTTLCGFSRYFADILIREPGLFRWLTAGDSLGLPRRREDLVREVEHAGRAFALPAGRVDALKRLHRREVLRIGVRDILGHADLVTVTSELSLLADVLVQEGFAAAAEALTSRFPVPPPTPYTVVALGKLGGGELNYSSDIDLMVIYGEEGDFADAHGRAATHHQYFVRLVELAVEYLGRSSAEGYLYRVDLRLRPEGKAGPLARSLGACLLYYEARGQLWERQMLLKARPVAGDPEFGERVLRAIEPFVYPRTVLHHPSEAIMRIKAGIEAAVGEEENVKLRPGGIRDIEFAVQALQLLNGGKLPAVRSPNTLEAVRLLGAAGLLTAEEAGTLTDAYTFLRTVEHRLQFMENVRTHTLPPPGHGRKGLARRLGLAGEAEFLDAYHTRTTGARRVFEQVLAPSPSDADAGLAAVIEGHVGEETVRRFLEQRGFRHLRASTRALGQIMRGESPDAAGALDARRREDARQVAGRLIEDISATRDPDLTLKNLALLASMPPIREVFYRELHEPGFRNLMVTLCAKGTRLVRAMTANPSLLEEIMAPQAATALQECGAGDDPFLFRTLREFRAGACYVLGRQDFDALSADLTATADSVVGATMEREARKMRFAHSPLVLCAMGKYGTGEITFDADLDMLFIVEPGHERRADALERLSARVVASLSAVSGRGKGYDVDVRLRPEGRSAPLVIGRAAYSRYIRQRASLWERQSLTRFRIVHGREEAGARILDDVKNAVYRSPLPPGWVASIVAMRRKMETRSRVKPGGVVDVKLGPGGMADVEFLVQMLMLAAGPRGEEFHARPAVRVIAEIPSDALPPDARRDLTDAYRFYREVETMLRVLLEMHGTVLPEGERLDTLARSLDGSRGPELHDRCLTTMRGVRRTFLVTADHLATM